MDIVEQAIRSLEVNGLPGSYWRDAVQIRLTQKAERRISRDAVEFLGIGDRAERHPTGWARRALCQASYLPFRKIALAGQESVSFIESSEDQSEWVWQLADGRARVSKRTIRWLADRSDFEYREGQATKHRGLESNFILLSLVAILAFNRPGSGRTVEPWDRGSFSRKVPKLKTDLRGPVLDCVIDVDLDKWDFDKRIRPTLFNGGGAGKMQH